VSDLAHIPVLLEPHASAQPRPNVKRHLIAAAMSTLIPGTGQLFLGRKKKSIFLLLALIAISAAFWPLRLPKTFPGLIFLAWMCLLLSLFAIYDALLARDTHDSERISRWWILAGIPLTCLGMNVVFTSLLIGSGFRTFKFGSSSMEPTIFIGDKFVIDKYYYQQQPPERDDLVFMRLGEAFTVKRVIAIGGDTIEGKDRKIFVNSQEQDEPFIQHKNKSGAYEWFDTFGPAKVPAGTFFVMGDNRDVSLDSRSKDIGLVEAQSIVGKPLYVYRIFGHPGSWTLN
jgi:signal peptidase I